MLAGRELDALVAEKVMGWTWHAVNNICLMLAPQDVKIEIWSAEALMRHSIPCYSTDIGAAWQVVEKMGTRVASKRCAGDFILEWDHLDNCWCAGWAYYSYDGPQYEFAGKAETVPLAICLAGLDAVGYEPKETL